MTNRFCIRTVGPWCSGKCHRGTSGTQIPRAAFPMEKSCEASESQPPLKGKIYVPAWLQLPLETGCGKCASSDANPSYFPRDDNKSLMKFYSPINKKKSLCPATRVGGIPVGWHYAFGTRPLAPENGEPVAWQTRVLRCSGHNHILHLLTQEEECRTYEKLKSQPKSRGGNLMEQLFK